MSEQDKHIDRKIGFETEDVEAHKLKQGAAPGFADQPDRKMPLGDDEDVEGHRIKEAHVQPPRDADLGNTEH